MKFRNEHIFFVVKCYYINDTTKKMLFQLSINLFRSAKQIIFDKNKKINKFINKKMKNIENNEK